MYTQTIAPYAEPIHLNEAKKQVRAADASEDALLQQNIKAARLYVESNTGLQLVAATWKLVADSFAKANMLDESSRPAEFRNPDYASVGYPIFTNGTVELRKCPVVSVSGITYVDPDGTTQTLGTSHYSVDTDSAPARISPAYGESFPATRSVRNAVNITFNAGYVTPITVVYSTGVFTSYGRTFANNDVVRLTNSGGVLPTGLADYTDYHVINASGQTFKLSLTEGGAAVTLADNGTGTHFIGDMPETAKQAMLLLISHFYNNREAVVVTQGGTTATLDLGVESMLQDLRYSMFA